MKFLKWLLIILVVAAFISVCSEEIGGDKTDDTTESTAEQPKDYSSLVVPITKDGFPKTYNSWGEQWIGDINKAMPVAVNHIAKNDKCDEPVDVGLSAERSKPQHEAVFYVDCKNGERFYINQTQLNNNAEVKAESEKSVNLGMTPQEMGAGIDKIVKEVANVDTSLKAVQTDGNIYTVQMSDGVTWYGDVDSTGNAVVSMYNIKFKEKEQDEMLAAIIIAGANARVLSPELPKEQTAGELVKVANEAMTKFTDTLQASKSTKIVGNYKYIAEVVPEGRLLKVSFVHKNH